MFLHSNSTTTPVLTTQHSLEHDVNEAACLLVPDRQHGAVGVALGQGPILHNHVAQAGVQLRGTATSSSRCSYEGE